MDRGPVISTCLTAVLKPRGFRKRRQNWFRTTPGGVYQVVNRQKTWGYANYFLNIGWDLPDACEDGWLPSNGCGVQARAEAFELGTIEKPRPDGVSVLELPAQALLDHQHNRELADEVFLDAFTRLLVTPLAQVLDTSETPAELARLIQDSTSLPVTLAFRERLAAVTG